MTPIVYARAAVGEYCATCRMAGFLLSPSRARYVDSMRREVTDDGNLDAGGTMARVGSGCFIVFDLVPCGHGHVGDHCRNHCPVDSWSGHRHECAWSRCHLGEI